MVDPVGPQVIGPKGYNAPSHFLITPHPDTPFNSHFNFLYLPKPLTLLASRAIIPRCPSSFPTERTSMRNYITMRTTGLALMCLACLIVGSCISC